MKGKDAMAASHQWQSLHALRKLVLVIVLFHLGVAALSICSAVLAAAGASDCSRSLFIGALILSTAAFVRILWVVGTGLCQAATAVTMVAEEKLPASQVSAAQADPAATTTRVKRRMWYKRWLWWGRFGVLVTFFQVAAACYLTFLAVRSVDSSFCYSKSSRTRDLLQNAQLVLSVATWILALSQCCVGSDVLSWRSMYEMQNEAWRAHYRQIFDYGIRELLCCLGRSRTTMDNDEVDSVAALLGDLVSYRAAGASHLEFLAGVALLRHRKPKSPLSIDFPAAPEHLMKEATILHPYAVAAYTGFLLDIGRTPLFFPCVWMYRQGLLTLWNRHRWPRLDGDNWWRGHAAAFLHAARLPREALLKGRVHQKHRETVYFVIELQELQCVLVAIRGTETPEDLLTDGLGRECILSDSDIRSLLMNANLSEGTKEEIATSMPHYGHAGVVAAARELAFELDNPEDNPEPDGTKKIGFLTSILGPGGRCEGYSLRFVGHSLGGSIAGITGMLLSHRFPNLHVYGYGILPCVDSVVAEACSSFMTSIVYNDEFSSRLSVASLMRLRGAALQALAMNSDTDSAVLSKLGRLLLGSKRKLDVPTSNGNLRKQRLHNELKGIHETPSASSSVAPLQNVEEAVGLMRGGDELRDAPAGILPNGIPQEKGDLLGYEPGSDLQELWPVELVMPGLIIHIVRCSRKRTNSSNSNGSSTNADGNSGASSSTFGRGSWYWSNKNSSRKDVRQHKAILRDRDCFREIVVSPSMFLDHMPWRCQRGLGDVVAQFSQAEEAFCSPV